MVQTIIIEIPMVASPVAQSLILMIAGIAVVRGIARFLDTLPVA